MDSKILFHKGIIIITNSSLLGTGDDYITMAVEQCAIQKCVLIPVNISAVNQLSINLEPPANHDTRIELVDVKHNITVLSTFGKNPRGSQVHINHNHKNDPILYYVLIMSHRG